jgi:hypothetical protein
MTQIPLMWKEDYTVIPVQCQRHIVEEPEAVLVASTERYEALQQPSGVFWVRFNRPHPRGARMQPRILHN